MTSGLGHPQIESLLCNGFPCVDFIQLLASRLRQESLLVLRHAVILCPIHPGTKEKPTPQHRTNAKCVEWPTESPGAIIRVATQRMVGTKFKWDFLQP